MQEKFELILDNGDVIVCSKAGNGKRIGYIVGGPGSFYFSGLSCLEEDFTFITYDAAWTYSKASSFEKKKMPEMTKDDMIKYDHLIIKALKKDLKIEEIDGFGFSAPGALLFEEALTYPEDFSSIIGTSVGLTELDPTFAKTNTIFYSSASIARQQALDAYQNNYKSVDLSLKKGVYDERMAFFDIKPKNKIPLMSHKQFVAETIAMIPKVLFDFSNHEKASNTVIEHWKHNPFKEHIDKRMQELFFNNIYPQLQPFTHLLKLAKTGKRIILIYGDSDFVTPLPVEIREPLFQEPNIQLEIIQDCGHMPYKEASQKYQEIICNFIKESVGYTLTI